MRHNRTIQTGRLLCLLAGTLLGATIAVASTTVELNTDRGGADYAGYDLPSPDPLLCRKACDQDAKCKAYTYVKPGIQGPTARCYLKDPAPAAKSNNCCVSGVKTATPAVRATPSNQQQTQPQTTAPSVKSTQPVAEAPPIMQLGIVAHGAARQWATEALTRSINWEIKKPSFKFRQLVGFSSFVHFSIVNPNISSITVSIDCFGLEGKKVNVGILHAAEKGPLISEIALAAYEVAFPRVQSTQDEAIWCRARSNSPFLFSASLVTGERFFTPPGMTIELKHLRTPIKTFVLVK